MIKKYCVDDKNDFRIEDFPKDEKDRKITKEESLFLLEKNIQEIDELQQKLYAEKKEGVIFLFQAMDAAGKDGTIRHVLTSLSPQGVKENPFKAPSKDEMAHDYLWRIHKEVPKRGNIAIFNRSQYEDVLIVKVKELYKFSNFPERIKLDQVINNRYDDINNFEKYLYRNGIRTVKIFLNVSKEEQAKRFLERIEEAEKNWKFDGGDLEERKFWDAYQQAFEDAIRKTSNHDCPWYIVPADDKWYMRLVVSEIVLAVLKDINPKYPELSKEKLDVFEKYRDILQNEINK
jgi:PPK2 family polyphosphate:nucleotide phosphotransferase